MSRYAVLRACGAALTGVLVAGGAVSSAPALVRQVETVPLAWPAAATALELRPGPGSVEVREGSTPRIEVELTTSFADTTPSLTVGDEGVVALGLACPEGMFVRCHADWEIVVPVGTDVSVEGSVGDASLEGVTGDVRVKGSVGDVRISGSPDLVDVSLNVGGVHVDLDDPATELSVLTNVGDIDLLVPGEVGYDVRTRADSADIQTRVRDDSSSPHRIAATTNVGRIRIDGS